MRAWEAKMIGKIFKIHMISFKTSVYKIRVVLLAPKSGLNEKRPMMGSIQNEMYFYIFSSKTKLTSLTEQLYEIRRSGIGAQCGAQHKALCIKKL